MAKYDVAVDGGMVPAPRYVRIELTAEHRTAVAQARMFLKGNPGTRTVGVILGATPQGRDITVVITTDDAWVEFTTVRDTLTVDDVG
jgi:hypothetical protein